ncbi:MAG: universal stress protein [Planctomycetes bacterium]|nr:universal stress protein [Planctomycetota bacterium]
MKHILIASDLSPESLRPCKTVVDLAGHWGAKVTLLHVVQDLKVAPHGAPLAPALSSPDLEKELKHARLALEDQRAALTDGVAIEVAVVASEKIPQAIDDYAEANGVDLIAISTHGRTGWRHLALGSVAEAVIRHAHVPVLTFPRPKE